MKNLSQWISLLAIIVGLTPSIEAADDWQKLKSFEGNFETVLPGEPEYNASDIDTDIGAVKMHSFTVETKRGQTAYFIFYSDYPEDEVNEQTDTSLLLSNARDGVVGNDGTRKTREKEIRIGKYPGLEFDFEEGTDTDTTYGNWRLYLVKNRLYQIGIISIGKPVDKQTVDKMMNSFRLLKNEGP